MEQNNGDELPEDAYFDLLPLELADLIRTATGAPYLNALSQAALLPQHTQHIFSHYERLVPELVARWTPRALVSTFAEEVSIVSAYARIVPFASYLRPCLRSFFKNAQNLRHLSDASTDVLSVPTDQLQWLLLAFFRLFTDDPDAYGDLLHPVLLSSLLFKLEDRAVRYLAIRCLVCTMRLADAVATTLIAKYVGHAPMPGDFDGIEINYQVLELCEERRHAQLHEKLTKARLKGERIDALIRFSPDDLSTHTAVLGGILVPRPQITSERVLTNDMPTSEENKHRFAEALLKGKAVLVAGPSGSGKTFTITECARELGKADTLVSLQLNAQTDAKSLIGTYVSSSNRGTFVWQPGVLATALRGGKWVLVEDLDRAPPEALSLIAEVAEKGEIFSPGRKEHFKAADGFSIVATTKQAWDDPRSKLFSTLNRFHWSMVRFSTPDLIEVTPWLRSRYKTLGPLLDEILKVHEVVSEYARTSDATQRLQDRDPTLRELMKLCRRAKTRMERVSKEESSDLIPETFKMAILQDALDCHAGHLDNIEVQTGLIYMIAKALNIAPKVADYMLREASPDISVRKSSVTIGRATLIRQNLPRTRQHSAPFAFTRQTRLNMEKVACALQQAEPILLVGETGVGKTTLVQRLAEMVDQRLTVINLSNQSEGTDLLGGLRPVSAQSFVVPQFHSFVDLFDETFSARKNEKFQQSVQKAFKQQNWQRLLALWQQAVDMAQSALGRPIALAQVDIRSAKRRKLASPRHRELQSQWTKFEAGLKELRMHIDRSSQHPIFEFVESRLVKAVRDGEWLLLDEINLASSDTLDHIISLLQSSAENRPFLMISEKASNERLEAHPNFRIFAAMNPASDTGKKQLAPDLRSRFTEIYVDAGDDKLKDLSELISAYLGPLGSTDTQATKDLALAYLEVKLQSSQNRLSDHAGDISCFSLRSLVRCLQFIVQHAATMGLRRSMFEGFQMTFLTTLSKEAEVTILPEIREYLLSNVKNTESFFSQPPTKGDDEGKFIWSKHHSVLRGPEALTLPSDYILTASIQHNLEKIARAVSMQRFPILLQGPTSSGKTSMIQYLARLTGNKMVRVNNHEHTDIQEYLGSYSSGQDGKLQYLDGVLVESLRKGFWVVLDELNLAPSDVLEALNRLLDDNRELLVPETQEIVRPHPNFMLFATQNPAGLYGGRKRLSRAFRNRFLEIHFDEIPDIELEIILTERARIPPSYCAQIVAVYKALSLQRQSSRIFEQRNSFATLRDLFRWASRPAHSRQDLAEHGFMLLAERVRNVTERQQVKRTIEDVFRLQIQDSALYGPDSVPDHFPGHDAVVWTPAMRRLFVLIIKAIANNEPVVLVGDTGCGKTQICQVVAEALDRRLDIFNANANTETGDLIGSQRPVRNRAAVSKQLYDTMRQLLHRHADPNAVIPLQDLLQLFNRVDQQDLDESILEEASSQLALYNSLFHWVDGSLVKAMKEGSIFLLDEVSLAEDSVLERLNSVLEPSRTILLAEKGAVDNQVVASNGFQFLSTMNPGGDYGKRELSTALRNRLTEIWVPPLTETEDLLPILSERLNIGGQEDAARMLRFAEWFIGEFQSTGTLAKPLRSLLTWVEFANLMTTLHPVHAIIHGAAMVFIDSLGTDAVLTPFSSTTKLRTARNRCLDELARIFEYDSDVVHTCVSYATIDDGLDILQVGHFSIHRRANSNYRQTGRLVLQTPTTQLNLVKVVRALQMTRPILLEGDPGVGKTALITALASMANRELTRINLSDQTDLMDLYGADVPSESESIGTFVWRDGPLLQAMHSGNWVLLDEMNLATQSVLEGLNSCLDHRKEVFVAELERTFSCHPEFRIFAAQNPHHQGGGRKGLPASFLNRFTVLYVDAFERIDLQQILAETNPLALSNTTKDVLDCWEGVQRLIAADPAFQSSGAPWELNLRDLNRWLQLIEKYPSLQPMHHSNWIVVQRFRTFEQTFLISNLLTKAGSCEHSLYHKISESNLQVGSVVLKRDSLLQLTPTPHTALPNHLLKYAEAVGAGIKEGWPIILVGESGCGKTVLIQYLAAVTGASLVEVSMNADIDTMDLVGGFEQYDPQKEITEIAWESQRMLRDMLASELQRDSPDPNTVPTILSALRVTMTASLNLELLRKFLQTLKELDTRLESLSADLERAADNVHHASIRFVWKDGVLIDALKNGSWLVLDNANLCNSSVLDRLNSLLEPDGQLIVSEQHTSGEAGRIIKPHADFRIFLTMNPQRGELSRAMRNRSLEICILDSDAATRAPGLEFATTASMSRLRYLRAIEAVPPDLLEEAVTVAVNHLSISDTSLVRYLDVSCLQSRVAAEVTSHSELLKCFPNTLQQRVVSVCQAYNLETILGSSAQNQPVDLLYNEPLLQLGGGSEHLLAQARAFALQRDFLMDILRFRREAVNLRDHEEPMTRVEPLRRVKRNNGPRLSSTQLLRAICDLLTAVSTNLLSSDESEPLPPLSHCILSFGKQVLSLPSHLSSQQVELQSIVHLGHLLCKNASFEEAGLASQFDCVLKTHGHDVQLSSGQSMQRLWPTWRPRLLETPQGLSRLFAVETILQQLDRRARNDLSSVEALANAKLQIIDAFESVHVEDPAAAVLLKHLEMAVAELSLNADQPSQRQAHFAPIYDHILWQMSFLDSSKQARAAMETVALLSSTQINATLSSTGKSSFPRRMAQLTRWLNLGQKDGWEGAGSDWAQILLQCGSVLRLPLHCTAAAPSEIALLMRALCSTSQQLGSNIYTGINRYIAEMVVEVLSCHEELLSEGAIRVLQHRDQIDSCSQICALLRCEDLFKHNSEEHGFLANRWQSLLAGTIQSLTNEIAPSASVTGRALALFSLAGIQLFVPDQAFDPALLAKAAYANYDDQITHIQRKLHASKFFERQFTGQSRNLFIDLMERQCMAVKKPSESEVAFRPVGHALDQISDVFKKILHLPLLKQLPGSLVQSPVDFGHTFNLDLLRQSVSELLARLSSVDRAYDDITKPVEWLLKTLVLGCSLFDIKLPNDEEEDASLNLALHTPFIGESAEQLGHWQIAAVDNLTTPVDLRLRWLENFRLHRCIVGFARLPDQEQLVKSYLGIIDSFYREWKTRLGKDQLLEEERSRYYAYRATSDEDEQIGEEEREALFPSFANDSRPVHPDTRQISIREVAIELASLQTDVFGLEPSPISVESHIERNLTHMADLVNATSWSSSTTMSLTHLLPAALLKLRDHFNALNADTPAHNLNLYSEGDIFEARQLHQIVDKAIIRFRDIAAAWPEHAVPQEVLRQSHMLLELALNDPIAQLLNAAEKLFETIVQWQSIASREFSADTLQSDLAQLIIRWRRLELSSWSRLLDVEKKKQEIDTGVWYFMLYELLVENPGKMLNDDSMEPGYLIELSRSIEEFLKTSTVGQFAARLALLQSFEQVLYSMVTYDQRFEQVAKCVVNVLQYFRRFEAPIKAQHSEGRDELDRRIQEQIKLASWKDANPVTLKESARKSHYQLTKVVKNYRKLLFEPIKVWKSNTSTLLPQEFRTESYCAVVGPSKSLETALQYCMDRIPDWNIWPQRIRQPVATSTTMYSMYMTKNPIHLSWNGLFAFQSQLEQEIRQLRSETPKTSTEDNEPLVRHLKERKRRLLVETMRFIAALGIRRNLSSTELDKQSSTANILGLFPTLSALSENKTIESCNLLFFELLDQAVQVRSAILQHSEELTDGQIKRSVGLIEGMLFLILKQRHVVGVGLTTLRKLQETLFPIKNLEGIGLERTKWSNTTANEKSRAMTQRLLWLPHILRIAAEILEIHSTQTQRPHKDLAEAIYAISEKIKHISKDLDESPLIPNCLVSVEDNNLHERAEAMLADLGNLLCNTIESRPDVEYIVRKVSGWLHLDYSSTKIVNGVTVSSIDDFSSLLQEAANTVFVAIQQLQYLDIANLTSDTHGWWNQHFDDTATMLKILHVSQVTAKIQSAIAELQHLQSMPSATAASLLITFRPIFQQFLYIVEDVNRSLQKMHLHLISFAVFVARTFNTLATEGFCSPAGTAEADEQVGQLEAGTGLGEGQGAQDISGDVNQDEDISELAQAEKAAESAEPIEKSKDVVDLDHDELEGEFDKSAGDEQSEQSEQEDAGSHTDEERDLNEETGSVDELDPSAVDEKVWDKAKQDAVENKTKRNTAQKRNDNDQTRTEGLDGDEDDGSQRSAGEDMQEDTPLDVAPQPEGDQADPYTEEEEIMELPEDIDFKANDRKQDEDLSDDLVDEISDMDTADMSDTSMIEETKSEEYAKDDNSGEEEDNHSERKDTERADEDDQDDEQRGIEQERILERPDELMQYDYDENQKEDSGTAGGPETADKSEHGVSGASEQVTIRANDEEDGASEKDQEGVSEKQTTKMPPGREGEETLKRTEAALKNLADVLEKWHRRKEILPPSDDSENPEVKHYEDDELRDVDMEHTRGENDIDETQASGPAAQHEVRQHDIELGNPIEKHDTEEQDVFQPDGEDQEDKQPTLEEQLSNLRTEARSNEESSVILPQQATPGCSKQPHSDDAADDKLPEVSDGPLNKPQSLAGTQNVLSHSEAMKLWGEYSSSSHALSILLTEQLRMILAPTQATKLRGDFRTGKRLNIKRIIPYIASQYKRDKIWLRRSVPSKRNYQVMIAMDDSKSMMEGGTGGLAFETLAMLCKSLSSLEVGDLCVVGFGSEQNIRVAHSFGQPFTSDSGVKIFQNFSFNQNGTNVRQLLAESIHLFQDARTKASQSQSDLWQLELIVSDGVCEEHDAIQRLVRQATSEKIMVVFVIVDSTTRGSSIIDLTQASFEPDGEAGGEMKLKMRRYLETFPFPYYLVVRDVKELPGTLATALKGWFAQVVDVQS